MSNAPTIRQFFAAVALLGLFAGPADAQSPFAAGAAPAGRGLDSAMPSESVDPFSGSLSVVATDLVLPGNAGLDLRVQRVYSSSIYPNYNDNDLSIEEDSWAGIGWRLHFGRVLNPDATTGGVTQIEMGDGSRHALYTTTALPGGWVTKGFWIYDKTTHTLKLPSGIVYEFGHPVYLNPTLGTVRYVTEIRDPFNNRFTFAYCTAPGPADGIAQIQQHLGGGQVRTVTFTYDTTGLNALSTMTFNGRTWQYYHAAAGPPGHSKLIKVQPPAGPDTEYEYSSGSPGHELTKIWAPQGGTVTYTYEDVFQRAGATTIKMRGVRTRTLGGPDVSPGTWTFTYGTGSNQDTTRVDCPCGTTTYRFNGIGVTGPFSGWRAGTLAERTTEEGSTVLEREQLLWRQSEGISPDPTVGEDGQWSDPGVFKALLEQRVVTRGPHVMSTAFEYHDGQGTFNDYGRPWRTVEIGDLTRTVTRTFQYGFTPYIVDRTATEALQVGSQIVNSSWTYELSTGFLLGQSLAGPPLTFDRTPEGNVAGVTDARGNRTALYYTWGQVREVAAPLSRTLYTITANGWVEGVNNLLDTPTTYEYDAAGRPAAVRKGALNPVGYGYDDLSGRWIHVSRDTSWTKYWIDGFGRTIRTENAVGLKSWAELDACGRSTKASYPYTAGTGTRWVSTAYDALGRVKTVTDGGATTQYTYTGVDVAVTDSNNRQTHYDYAVFGDPGASRLVRVTDAAGQITDYTWDVLEHLTGVTGPNATPARTWVYNSHIVSDTQPESGTTTYQHDAAGNLTQKTTTAATVTFTYDTNNRLTLQDAPGTVDDVAYKYDAAGRLEKLAIPNLTSPTASTTFWYNALGHLTHRIDLVDGQTFQSVYGYDLNDRLTSITYPSGRVIAYEYDAEGRPLVVRNNGALFATNFTYRDSGSLGSYTTGAVSHTLTYDARERLERVTAGTAFDLTYGYDPASQVTAITDPRPGMSQAFTYDALGRLATATGPWGQSSWTYDPAGNRLTEFRGALTTYNYNVPTQRLTSTSGAVAETFQYDARGRLTSDSQGTYTYNGRELLATVTRPGLSATYAYDPGGLRVSSTVNADKTVSIRGAGGELLSEFRTLCGTTVWARDAVYVGGRILGSVRATASSPTVAVTTAAASVAEAQTSHNVGVRLTTANGLPTQCPVSVVYQTSAGTAGPGADYTTTSGTLTFATGTASGTVQNVPVTLLPDALDEDDETFGLTLATATGANVGAAASHTVTITDDDAAPTLAITDVNVTEGQTGSVAAVFTVSLSAVSGRVVQVAYATANGSAGAGIDYAATNGTLTIQPGSQSGPITVLVMGDPVLEPNETFTVNLSGPTHATVADAQGVATIINDDTLRETWGDFSVPLDGTADGALFNPSTVVWTFRDSQTGAVQTFGPWGIGTDVPVVADYDGDDRTDCAVYRPSSAYWYIHPSCLVSGAPQWSLQWGWTGDVPVAADYDGDDRADIAVFRQSDSTWHVRQSSTGNYAPVLWGQSWTPNIPTPGDYDGDGRADYAFYTAFNGVWWILKSSGGSQLIDWGLPGDSSVKPVAADYDGDGKTDLAFFAPTNGHWYIVPSTTGIGYAVPYGTSAMTPVPADYDGDGKTDLAQWDPAARTVWFIKSTTGVGTGVVMTDVSAPGDLPILRRAQ